MPIILHSQSDPNAFNGCGLAIYDWDPSQGVLDGKYVLAHFQGKLAREVGKKVGNPTELPGTYRISTYLTDDSLFASGLVS